MKKGIIIVLAVLIGLILVVGGVALIKTKTKTIEKNYGYAKRSGRIYYKEKVLENADFQTFSVINSFYAKDKDKVFCLGEELVKIDPATFEVVGGNGDFIARDKNLVVHKCEQIPVIDAKTLKFIEETHYKDASRVYIVSLDKIHIVEGADPNTFDFFSENKEYARDREYVYLGDKRLPDANPETFQSFKPDYYSKDDNHVFYHEKVIVGADPKTFEIIVLSSCSPQSSVCWSNVYGKDIKHIYDGDQIINIKPESLEEYNKTRGR